MAAKPSTGSDSREHSKHVLIWPWLHTRTSIARNVYADLFHKILHFESRWKKAFQTLRTNVWGKIWLKPIEFSKSFFCLSDHIMPSPLSTNCGRQTNINMSLDFHTWNVSARTIQSCVSPKFLVESVPDVYDSVFLLVQTSQLICPPKRNYGVGCYRSAFEMDRCKLPQKADGDKVQVIEAHERLFLHILEATQEQSSWNKRWACKQHAVDAGDRLKHTCK